MSAQFIGVGVGPGDPELITLKAARLIKQADVISYIANEQGQSQAKKIAEPVLSERIHSHEIPVLMPMSEDRRAANVAYDRAAQAIEDAINNGLQVVFLCEGDPLFFGSFGYLLERLQNLVTCQVVPGISSVHAAASALKIPLTTLKESFAVVSGRHDISILVDTLKTHDTVVIMKAGRSRQRILDAIATANRLEEANYLEYIGREGEYICTDISHLAGESGPYFSLFVVIKKQRARL